MKIVILLIADSHSDLAYSTTMPIISVCNFFCQ